MKIRNGFVSNSSSSSFVILKDALSNNQIDMILNYQYYVEEIFKNDNITKDEKERFEYYDYYPWKIIEYEDFIFGETSMDNFDMSNYLYHIKVDRSMICWDDGYNDSPWIEQIDFLNNMRQLFRKNKINNINKKSHS